MMTYTFSGQFQGALAPNFVEALSGVTVRLYRYRGTKYITSLAVSDPAASMKILAPDVASSKASALLGEATTDGDGNFRFVFDADSGYAGEAVEVDLLIPDVPFRKSPQPHGALQLALTTIRPRWEDPTNEGTTDSEQTTATALMAAWRYTIPADFWVDIRTKFDAWTVCGQVKTPTGNHPLPNVRVTAYDADWLQDDCLGSAITDREGKFRIDFCRDDFLKTPLSPIVNYEAGGPDLYFMVEAPDGELLLKEAHRIGTTPGRADLGHCTYLELAVAQDPESIVEALHALAM